nr:GAF domain-containing protein [Zhihengliuella flava]
MGDQHGRLLWVDGDRAALASAESMAFVPGADWSERSVGTSAPGTALATGAGVQVSGAEHYSRLAHRVSCTAVPIHGPTGNVLGVIDLTGGDDAVAAHSLSLVQAAVAAAEAELKLAAYATARQPVRGVASGSGPRPQTRPAQETALTVGTWGRDGVELITERGTDRFTGRHAEILALLAWHQSAPGGPRASAAGLSAEALALALWGEFARPVTLRAEISRLRHTLAGTAAALASRPYRLDPAPASDARRVLELVGRGRYRAALELYRGPLLPASTAPGIEAIRAEVSGALREAMLSDAGPEVLMSYLALSEAHDDVAAWRTALAVLPPRSPRRAVVVSHLEALEA